MLSPHDTRRELARFLRPVHAPGLTEVGILAEVWIAVREDPGPMTRRLLSLVGSLGLALTLTACIGPLADLGEPYPPSSSIVCCLGFERADLAKLVDAPVTETAHDEITLVPDTYRVRVDVSATSSGLNVEAAEDQDFTVGRPPLTPVDDTTEVLAVLLIVTVTQAQADQYGYFVAPVAVTAIGDTPESLDNTLISTTGELEDGSRHIVLLLVVPKGRTVVMCADGDDVTDPAWLNLRTGRLEPKKPTGGPCGTPRSR